MCSFSCESVLKVNRRLYFLKIKKSLDCPEIEIRKHDKSNIDLQPKVPYQTGFLTINLDLFKIASSTFVRALGSANDLMHKQEW